MPFYYFYSCCILLEFHFGFSLSHVSLTSLIYSLLYTFQISIQLSTFSFSIWSLQINGAGSFELEILEIKNDKSYLKDGTCCGSNEKSKTVDCPKCTTAFRLCLKEFSGGIGSLGCPFGENTTESFVLSSYTFAGQKIATITVPFSFRWTVSICEFFFLFHTNDHN